MFGSLLSFYQDYEMPLARVFFEIEKRGVAVDPAKLDELRRYVNAELAKSCAAASGVIGRAVAPSTAEAVALGEGTLNLGSPAQLLVEFKRLGLKVPRNRKTGKESTGEDQLNVMFAETGHPFLREILRVRELNKVLGTYVNAKLANNILYASYVVTGTVTGRRSSRANFLGLGTNHQNLPKHSDLGRMFRRCIVARPGKIFVAGDQDQAEDWIVQAIIADNSGGTSGLDELRAGVDRHQKLASFIFSRPADECGKGTPFRFYGKKTRHAGNYGMAGNRLSAELAKEGFHINRQQCEFFLTKFHESEPSIRGVFQRYVEREISAKRFLRTPFGRERCFFGCRPYGDNSSVFRDAYSYIPQSTVGDNTGLAILYFEGSYPGLVVMDLHDEVVLEVPDSVSAVIPAADQLRKAFDREIRFPNGTTIVIPTGFKIGYNLRDVAECGKYSEAGLLRTYNTLNQLPRA